MMWFLLVFAWILSLALVAILAFLLGAAINAVNTAKAAASGDTRGTKAINRLLADLDRLPTRQDPDDRPIEEMG